MPQPEFCAPAAFHWFAEQVPSLDRTEALLNAALAIAMHESPSLDVERVEQRIQQLADRVIERVRYPRPEARLAHLHQVLFEEEQFRGNTQQYYLPGNSYLPTVLETRVGIPITLTLLYKVVAERVGVWVEGVNAPGHFLARVHLPGDRLLIDPFSHGELLTEEEAFQRIASITGRNVPHVARYLAPATHVQWLSRMLNNLQQIFAHQDARRNVAAMSELQALLDKTP